MSLSNKSLYPYLMWVPTVLFFAYQFILRLWPGLMMPQIMAQYAIQTSGFGVIAACYYVGYAGMQIPVALLLDRYGARYIVSLFALICGVATLIFTYSEHFYLACLARFLIGAGSAVGFLGVSHVVSEWFVEKNYTRMIGASFSVGLLGAIYGGKPISLLLTTFDWHTIARALTLVSGLIALLVLLVVRPRAHAEGERHNEEKNVFKWSFLKKLLSNRLIWILAIANLLMVGALEGFSDVWGVSYLMTAFHIDKSSAAELISCVFFGMLFGGPLLAWCSNKLGNTHVIAGCGVGLMLAFMVILLLPSYQPTLLACMFFIVGILCCYQVVVFAAGSQLFPAHYLGVTIAFLNCINMFGGCFFHTIIGAMMDVLSHSVDDGQATNSVLIYRYTLSVIPIAALIGSWLVVSIRHQLPRAQAHN